MRIEFTAGPDDHDRRLESVVRRLLPHLSLGALHRALRGGDIRLNGAKAGPEARVASGDTLAVWDALARPPSAGPTSAGSAPAPTTSSVPRTPPLPRDWIVFEGPDLVVLNKPSGLLVHPGDGGPNRGPAPLDERVRAWLAPGASASLSFRPGPLHRLDRETSGLIVFSRTLTGARTFSQAVADRRVTKTYLAVLRGALTAPQEVRSALERDKAARTTRTSADGAEAWTRFSPLARAGGLTLAEVDLGTGRTHQIRAHAAAAGLPLAGDRKYGGGEAPGAPGLPWVLHAWRLRAPGLLPDLQAPFSAELGPWLEKCFKFSPPPADSLQ